MLGPKQHPVVGGTGGLRKIRFSPERFSFGKRGAFRVGYAYFPTYQVVVLIVVYPKKEKDDISAEGRKEIRTVIKRIEEGLATRSRRKGPSI